MEYSESSLAKLVMADARQLSERAEGAATAAASLSPLTRASFAARRVVQSKG